MSRQVDDERSAGDIPERFVPAEMHGQLVEAEHVARYSWASPFCSGRRVLDAGCGLGYGAEMLSRAGASDVVGIDVSQTALELARSAVTSPVTFEVADVASLPYGDGSFDVVVCFEVIEHVDNQDEVLDELVRVLGPDGLLLISSPNRDRYVPGNPHHRHEYTRDELQASLDARFAAVRIVSQHVMLASVISWADAPVFDPPKTERLVTPEPEDEIYLLAMAGRDLPPDPPPVVRLGLFAEPRRWLDHIELQKRYIDDQIRYMHDLEGREQSRRDALARLSDAQQALAEARQQLVEMSAMQVELERASSTARDQTAEAAALRSIVNSMTDSASWRLTAPLRRLARMARRS